MPIDLWNCTTAKASGVRPSIRPARMICRTIRAAIVQCRTMARVAYRAPRAWSVMRGSSGYFFTNSTSKMRSTTSPAKGPPPVTPKSDRLILPAPENPIRGPLTGKPEP